MSTKVMTKPAFGSVHASMRPWLLRIAAVFGFALAGAAQAENVLEDISYSALPGGKVELSLKFAQPVGAPQVFSTEAPPSIALDFPDVRNGLSKRRIDIGAGATSGVSAIESAGRTRVVVDLFRVAGYDTRANGETRSSSRSTTA